MNTLRIMSIIGIIVFTLSMYCIFSFNIDTGIFWGLAAAMYGIPFSIACLVQTNKQLAAKKEEEAKRNSSVLDDLVKLKELKDQGILTEEEFNEKRAQILKNL